MNGSWKNLEPEKQELPLGSHSDEDRDTLQKKAWFSVAKSPNSVAKTLSHRNSDRIMYVAKTQVAKPSATEFLFSCYFATELLSRKHIKFGR